MKPLLLFVCGLVGLFAVVVLVAIYRACTVKLSSLTRSPLAQAVFDGDTDKVLTLLDEGADANSTMNVTYQIAPEGCLSTSFAVPVEGRISFGVPWGRRRNFSLSFALPRFVVRLFGTPQPETGMSVLSFAAMQGSSDILRLLLDRGAEVNVRDKYGQTPLILAAWQGDAEMVALLLRKGAEVNAHDHSGKTAFGWARAEGHNSAAEVLKKAGARE